MTASMTATATTAATTLETTTREAATATTLAITTMACPKRHLLCADTIPPNLQARSAARGLFLVAATAPRAR
eukprot:7809966-Alexandrium_andersonii.AAC.1